MKGRSQVRASPEVFFLGVAPLGLLSLVKATRPLKWGGVEEWIRTRVLDNVNALVSCVSTAEA